jgi:hypothetical protein
MKISNIYIYIYIWEFEFITKNLINVVESLIFAIIQNIVKWLSFSCILVKSVTIMNKFISATVNTAP